MWNQSSDKKRGKILKVKITYAFSINNCKGELMVQLMREHSDADSTFLLMCLKECVQV